MKKLCSRIIVMCSCAVILNSCARLPFEPVEFQPVAGLQPENVRHDFQKALPEKFGVIESVLFRYRRHEVAAMGYTEIDSVENSLAFGGFTPMGIKIAEVKSVPGTPSEYSFTLPDLEGKVDFSILAESVAADIRRVYFERVPPADARIEKKTDRICFYEESEKGRLEWVFGGPGQHLFQKQAFVNGHKSWRVRYFDYKIHGGSIYPSQIYFENFAKKYKLTLMLKEILE